MANVTTGKPKVGGAIYRATAGTTPPVGTTAALTSFTGLGYVSDDGVSNANELNSENVKAWGGDVVLSISNGRDDTFTFKLIESLDKAVLETVYGEDNVEEDSSTHELSVSVNGSEPVHYCWVIDMIVAGDKAKRIVIPDAAITALGNIVYKDDEAIGYEVTLTAYADSSGNTHYEYIL